MFGKKIFYGWYIVAASLLIIILDGLLLYSFGVFLPYLNEDFGLSRAAGSSLFSFRSLVQAPAFILAGRMIDRFDPRAVIFGGGLIAALGMFLTGIAETTWQLYISYGFFIGLGDAVLDAVGSEGIRVHKLAVRDIPHSGKPDELVDHYGIGARSIVDATKDIIK